MNENETALARGFALAATEIARFELALARLLADPALPAVHKRDLRDRIDAIAERARRHASALREAEGIEPGASEQAERIDRLFLAELEASLEEGFRFMERRLGFQTSPGSPPPQPVEADRALRSLENEYQPPPSSVDSLGLVAERAAYLAKRAEGCREEGEKKLDRELLEVKRRSFLSMAALAGAENPELLFKCRLALESRLKTGSRLLLAPKAQVEGWLALMSGAGGELQAELFDRGLRLRMEFQPSPEPGLPAGRVGGWVESGGERADFGLADPRRPMGAQASPAPRAAADARGSSGSASPEFLAFLSAHELSKLYGELLAQVARLGAAETARKGEDSPAARLSTALDELL